MDKLQERYPKIEIIKENDKIHIHNLWGDNSFFLRFNEDADLSFLNNLYFPPELMAMYSLENNHIEVFAFPISPDSELIKRKFDFNFQGETFVCEWSEPTEEFIKISTSFRELKEESHTAYRNLRQFRDYYRIEELPDFMSKYFEDKRPYNFFIKGNLSKVKDEIIEFCKTLNFYMSYFDRETPNVQIFPTQYNKEVFNLPCYSLFDTFPTSINATNIDNILLDIITVANKASDPRLRFIFYYQILEYASYYFLKSDIKDKLNNILKRPDVSFKSEDYSKQIIEQFKNHFNTNDDKTKLDMLINEHIKLNDLQLELENNIEYFSKPVEFDGGFIIEPIMKESNTSIEQLPDNTIKTIKENIVSIRNSLVHLREYRENKVILPTDRNDNLLIPYIYLVRRIAEKIVIDR
jgi:hypothetical protein